MDCQLLVKMLPLSLLGNLLINNLNCSYGQHKACDLKHFVASSCSAAVASYEL